MVVYESGSSENATSTMLTDAASRGVNHHRLTDVGWMKSIQLAKPNTIVLLNNMES